MKKNKRLVNILLITVAIIGLCIRLFALYNLRTSHLLDEAYSYGFANNPGEPWFIHPGPDENGDMITVHYGRWYSGNEFMKFLTVNEGEQFDFSAVIENKLEDTSPSNFEILLHFVSSFFPERFSWNYAFVINLFFYIGTLILICLIMCKLFETGDHKVIYAIACMVYFSFTLCGTGSFTFFRMYGILSFYALLLFYIMLVFRDVRSPKRFIYLAVLCAGSFMGYFTHFNFLIYAFSITLFTCLYFLISKDFKNMLLIGITELLSVVLFFVIYPFPFNRAGTWMSFENSEGYSYFTRLVYSNRHMFDESIGFYIPFSVAEIIKWAGILVFIVIVISLFAFLFRKEKWFASFKSQALSAVKPVARSSREIVLSICPWIPIAFCTAVLYMLIVNSVAPILTTKGYVTRYFFIGMHLVILSFAGVLLKIFDHQKRKVRMILGPVLILLVCVLLYNQKLKYGNPFLFSEPYDPDNEMTELMKDQNVMIFSSDCRDLYCLIIPLRTVKSFFYMDCYDQTSTVDSVPAEPFYVMVDMESFPEDQLTGQLYGSSEGNFYGENEEYPDYLRFRLGDLDNRKCEYVRNFYAYPGNYRIYYIE